MRTNIDIDDALLDEARELTGIKTKREVVERALRELIRVNRQAELRKYRGKLPWEGDIEAMRVDAKADDPST
jgi:Arc/MetJ family transcription regulator